MPTFARDTEVSIDRSRTEIERTLQRFGARKFAYGWADGVAVVQFEMRDRRIKFLLPLPDENDPEIALTQSGRRRSEKIIAVTHEQAKRARWRSLLHCIKSKLISVEAVGILDSLGEQVRADERCLALLLLLLDPSRRGGDQEAICVTVECGPKRCDNTDGHNSSY